LIAQSIPADLAASLARLERATGAAGIAELARKRGDDATAVANAVQALGSALGLDWLQAAAAQLSPTDPWERLLVTGVGRDIQDMRLACLSRAGQDALGTYVVQWLERHGQAIAQFQTLLTRARAGSPSAAMLAEIAARARALLHRA
jgi:glutamate dehydrogenase